MTWAISQVVETNGVTPAKFPGLVADSSNVYRNSILSFVTKFIEGISIHGPIAAFLTRESWTFEGIRALAKGMA